MSTAEQQRRWRESKGARQGVTGRPPTAPCGTVAAYKRHRRNGEEPCQPCKDANAAATKARRKRAGGGDA